MCLVDDDTLYLPLSPHVEPLCLGFSVDFAGDVEMLHNDTIDIHRHRIADDSRSDLPRVVRIDARYFTHMAVPTAVAILSLASACAAKLRIQPVFFTREVDELPGEDSSVGTHDAAHGICIDAEVNSKDGLLLNRLLLKEDYLFIGEAEGIAMIPFHQSGSGSIGTGPVLADEIGILLSQMYRDPDPVVLPKELEPCGVVSWFALVHVIPIESGHGITGYLQLRSFSTLPVQRLRFER